MEAQSDSDVAFGRGKICATLDSLLVGAPRSDTNGKVYAYHKDQFVQTFDKPDQSPQPFGDIFALGQELTDKSSQIFAAVIVPHRPGPPTGNGGKNPLPMLSPSILDVYKEHGSGGWVKHAILTSKDHRFGDAGFLISGNKVMVATAGENEEYPNIAIKVYDLQTSNSSVTLRETVYPKAWGPNQNAFRFSGFDYRGGLLIGLWNDGLDGYDIGDNGPLRVWDSGTSRPPTIIENRKITQAKVINSGLIIAVSNTTLFTYKKHIKDGGVTEWKQNMSVSPGKFVRNALAVSASGETVAVRTYKDNKSIVMVFSVSKADDSLKLIKGMYIDLPFTNSAGLAVTDTQVYSTIPGSPKNLIRNRRIQTLPKASLDGSKLTVEEDTGVDDVVPPGSGGGGVKPPSSGPETGDTQKYLIIFFILCLIGALLFGLYKFAQKQILPNLKSSKTKE